MDLANTPEIVQPEPDAVVSEWRNGDAWLAGGTWLFRKPQPQRRRLVDPAGRGWTPRVVIKNSLEIAASPIVNASFRNYRIPTFVDVPPTEIYFGKTYDAIGPLRAKSVSEAL